MKGTWAAPAHGISGDPEAIQLSNMLIGISVRVAGRREYHVFPTVASPRARSRKTGKQKGL